MGNCIICGTSTDGPICDVHQEDVVFEFEGNDPSQLTPGRFYLGTIDGYADFGVFVNIGNVTGLLHRSKLDRRLESLDWEVGDEVCVQVNNVRENGDIDLDRSIRQSPEDFRGMLVQTPDGARLLDTATEDEADESTDVAETAAQEPEPRSSPESETDSEPASRSRREPEAESGTPAEAASTSETSTEPETESASASAAVSTAEPGQAPEFDSGEATTAGGADTTEGVQPSERVGEEAETPTAETTTAKTSESTNSEPSEEAKPDIDRIEVEVLSDHVGETVRLEGVVASVRQTSGPTVFELRDETGIVDCAAFVEAGVRAYPEIEADDVVRLDGEVRVRRDEIQVETESLVKLEGDALDAVETRMEDALEDRASPGAIEPLVADPAIEAVTDGVGAVATEIRRAVIESRPIVVRHDATTDGYVAGAAIERAVLPLVAKEHATADAVYHYFDRRPLEDGVYDMNDATKDVTRMLGDRNRHDEKLPLFVFAAAGSTDASSDGLELLDIYDAPRVVLDGRPAEQPIVDTTDSLVTVDDRTATTVAATIAAAVNDDIREDVRHLPAVSYWAEPPEQYVDLADTAGLDAAATKQLREAIALEAFYQSYEDKRQLIIDLLFEKRTGLAEQVSEQFGTKLDAEIETARENLEERTIDGTTVTVLDTEAYTHKYDFPPTRLLLDELARRLASMAIIGLGTDELHIRSASDLDLEAIVESVSSAVPNAGVSDPGGRQPKLEFLAGEREAVAEAVVEAITEGTLAPSA